MNGFDARRNTEQSKINILQKLDTYIFVYISGCVATSHFLNNFFSNFEKDKPFLKTLLSSLDLKVCPFSADEFMLIKMQFPGLVSVYWFAPHSSFLEHLTISEEF